MMLYIESAFLMSQMIQLSYNSMTAITMNITIEKANTPYSMEHRNVTLRTTLLKSGPPCGQIYIIIMHYFM